MYNIIGLSGAAGSGKDTVAKEMKSFYETHGYVVDLCRFSDPIYKVMELLFGWTYDELQDRLKKETVDLKWGFSPRHAMQTFGTEWGRKFLGEDIWLNFTKNRYVNNIEKGAITIITDVRFENEAAWIRSQEYSRIVIVNNEDNMYKTELSSHASEQGIDVRDIDFVLWNDVHLGMEHLRKQVKVFLSSD